MFYAHATFKNFLKKFFSIQPGEIVNKNGQAIGQHQGLMYYTYGQRQGLGIGGGYSSQEAPWYVSDKIIDENKLVVVQGQTNSDLYHTRLTTP